MTPGGPGLVAVGVDWNVELPPDAAVWTSTDGMTWSRAGSEASLGGESIQQMWSVTAAGPGLVAVGISTVDDVFSHESAVWTSEDGISWSREPHDPAIFGEVEYHDMWGVATDGTTVVVVGSSGPVGDADAAVWQAN